MRHLSSHFKTLIHWPGIATLSLCFMLILIVQINAFADRGRPHLDSSLGFNRLLTDKNTPLRGVSLSWDGGDNDNHTGPAVLPTQSQLNALSTVYGFNALHVYLEMNCPVAGHAGIHQVGKNAALCDQLVNMTGQANLYLIITIGCGNNNGRIASMSWAQQFWNLYAPRYANRTHVIYESHNEPGDYTPARWTTTDWDNQVTLYNTIRSKAPNTHIMTCSFMSFSTPREALNGIGYMRWKGVNFSNASVAFHGYETMESVENCISTFKSDMGGGMTPALVCTEFDPNTTYSGFNNMLENQRIGWLEFKFLHASDGDLTWLKTALQNQNVLWIPDYGNWPRSAAPIGKSISLKGSNNLFVTGENGTAVMKCNRPSVNTWESFTVVDAGNGKVGLRSMGKYVSSENGVAAMNANRGTIGGWELFDWISVGTNRIVLKGTNGKYVSSENGSTAGMNCNRNSYADWETFTWALSPYSGRVETPMALESEPESVFPNPCTNELYYNNVNEAKSLSIIDINGKEILNQSLMPNINTVNVSSLVRGFYFVKAQTKNGLRITKVAKE